jgi:hypothetical protein
MSPSIWPLLADKAKIERVMLVHGVEVGEEEVERSEVNAEHLKSRQQIHSVSPRRGMHVVLGI